MSGSVRELRYAVPDGHAIPVDRRIDDSATRAAWAAEAVQGLSSAAELPPQRIRAITEALNDLAAMMDDETMLFLVMSADAGLLAPLTIYVTDESMTRDDVAEFLSTPTTLLPPSARLTETRHLGTGFSSSLFEGAGEQQWGSRRWVFFGQGSDVAAMLGPVVPPYALAFVEGVAEAILAETSVTGFVPAPPDERLAALEAAAARAGDTWSGLPAS